MQILIKKILQKFDVSFIWIFGCVLINVNVNVNCFTWMNTCAEATLGTQAYLSKTFYGDMYLCKTSEGS